METFTTINVMKRFVFSLLASFFLVTGASAQLKYVDATELGLVNKLCPTENRYHRVDTDKYDLTKNEANLLRMPAGMALVFRTNSSRIGVRTDFLDYNVTRSSTTAVSQVGYDLYIRRDGEWLYAGSNAPKDAHAEQMLIRNMDDSEKECLLYLPLFCELQRIEIGIDEGATIEALPNPFRHRIVIFGSSFTQGTSTGRPGMSYPMIMQRSTGLQFINLGVAGNSKLQQSFARIIGDNDCDAIIVDAFSNPGPEMIRERFLPFVAAIRKAHPHVPVIFLQTIYRERANFDLQERAREEEKRRAAREVFAAAAKIYDGIYFVDEPNLTGTDHITSLDGTHPDDLGYWRWANAIRPRIVKILKKHGIR